MERSKSTGILWGLGDSEHQYSCPLQLHRWAGGPSRFSGLPGWSLLHDHRYSPQTHFRPKQTSKQDAQGTDTCSWPPHPEPLGLRRPGLHVTEASLLGRCCVSQTHRPSPFSITEWEQVGAIGHCYTPLASRPAAALAWWGCLRHGLSSYLPGLLKPSGTYSTHRGHFHIRTHFQDREVYV